MKRIIYIIPILVLFITGCSNNPVADFIFEPDFPAVGEQVSFNNLSIDAEYVEWNFGDGTISSVYHPIHTFVEGGTFTVTLTAFGRRDKIDIYSTQIVVTNVDPVADFGVFTDLPGDSGPLAVETDIVFVGEQVEFYNTSVDATSFVWDLGDGTTTDIESPVYSYDSPGTYTIKLKAYSVSMFEDTYTKKIEVVEGVNSALRITVLEYFDEYPVEGASVLLFPTVSDWENETNALEEVFTTALGKCVFEGLDYQSYYVDVWEADHDNYKLAAEDVGFIQTQELEPGYIHDFIAYVDYYTPEKKMALTRIGKKQWAKDETSLKKASDFRTVPENKFSQKR